MNLSGINVDVPGLVGTQDEQPRVLKAFGCQLPDEQGRMVFYLACVIRHYDPERRIAMTKSNQSRAHAAKCMLDNLNASSIEWNGDFQWGTPAELGLVAEAEEAPRLILDG